MNMLTSVTQSCQQIQQLIDDFKILDGAKSSSSAMLDGDRMDMGGGMGGFGMGGMGMRMGGNGGNGHPMMR